MEDPYLYCGRRKYVNRASKSSGMLPLFVFSQGIHSVLPRGGTGGNNTPFNAAVRLLIEREPRDVAISQEQWTYRLIAYIFTNPFNDKLAHPPYIQYKFSLFGGNNSFSVKKKQTWMLLQRRFRRWNREHSSAFILANRFIVKNYKEILGIFEILSIAKFTDRFVFMKAHGLGLQTRYGRSSWFLTGLNKKCRML